MFCGRAFNTHVRCRHVVTTCQLSQWSASIQQSPAIKHSNTNIAPLRIFISYHVQHLTMIHPDQVIFWFHLGVTFYKPGSVIDVTKMNTRISESRHRTFKSLFGCTPEVLHACWRLLIQHTDIKKTKAQPIHLLWCCLFLKEYGKESIHSMTARTTEKTFRKWTWLMIHFISDLESHVVRIQINVNVL